jgi:hypothetical protein
VKRAFLFLPLVFALVARPQSARAQAAFPPITNRNFNIDLFEQPALGSPRLVAMSGAVNSVAEGAAGLYTNPASAALRPETKSGKFAWNIYLNSYIPASGQDSNNNGQADSSYHRSLLGAAGVLLQYGQWGLTIDGGYAAHEIAVQAGGGLGVRSLIAHVALARILADGNISVGLGVRAGGLNIYTLDTNQTLFTRAGLSGEVGVVWKPRDQDFRVAVSGGLPIETGAVQYNCDPNNCLGYILPSDAVVPWDATIGGAWRFASSYWNHQTDDEYRDERDLTVALDLSFMGAVSNGYGLEAFAAKQLQQSGRNITLTPRLGLESNVIKGWLRLRAGTYDESSRFPQTSARLHATGGGEVRLFAFNLLGQQRRVSLSFAADVATQYQNVGLSLGFWN